VRSLTKYILFFLLLAYQGLAQIIPFISEKSLAPGKKYSVQFWTTENGLPQNSVNGIAQTADGYLWLATFDGLVQFDGIKFRTFNASNTPALKTSGIRRLYVDPEDRLWLITTEGDLISYKKNVFSPHVLPQKIDYIKSTLTFFNGKVVVVCGENKLYEFTSKGFEPMPVPSIKKIYCIQTINKNTLYVGTDKGLWKYSGNKWLNMPSFEEKGLSQLYVSPTNELIVDAEFKLYRVWDSNTKEIEVPFALQALNEYKLSFDEMGRLMLLTEMGLWTLTDKSLSRMTTEDGLSTNVVNSHFIDREKNTWVGTNNGGLNRLKPKIFKTFAKEDGMFEDGATAMIELKAGSILIGNNCKGTSEFYNGVFVNSLPQLKNDVCTWSLMEDKQGRLWVGTYGGGVSVYRKDGGIDNYRVTSGLSDNVIFAMYPDSKGNVWIGTAKGLTCFANQKFTVLDTSFRHKITHIAESKNAGLWLCTDIGLAQIKNDKIMLPGKELGLKEGAVRYVYEDADGGLWIGSSGNGLARIKNGKAFNYSSFTNLLDKNVWSIVEDVAGNFWMPSNTGMYVVNKKELNDFADAKTRSLNITYLGKEDGLKSIEFNGGFQPSALRSRDGKFWFPTVKGAAMADPYALARGVENPQVVIEKMALNDSLVDLTDTLIVDPSTRTINLFFTAPSFASPSRLTFQFKIEGFDNDWNNLGTSRELKLTNIPDGMHKLYIRVTGNDTGKEASLVIYKPVPIWKQAWFISGAVITFLLFLILFTITLIGRIRKREKRKTQLNKQYANIELKALQAQLNPHFIFNCLNSIQHFIIANDEASASKYLTKFSVLMRMFLEHSKSNHVSLQQEIELLKLYVEIESLRFKNGFDFKLEIAEEVDAFNIQIPGMLFQPFVENAIKHGLLNLDRKGKLLISFYLRDSELVCIIEDDGVGRVRAKELRSALQQNHTSRGMEIIEDRVSAINYIENTHITIEIIDKEKEGANMTGTRILIKIPI